MAGTSDTRKVLATLSYVKRFAGQTVLIKIGGAALEDLALVRSICEGLMLIRSVGVKIVLVHGGGPAINRELTTHGLTWEFIDGQRVTTPEMMDVIEMVLCGHVNKRIVRALNHQGIRAVGTSGIDGSTLLCKQASVKLGQVGHIERVNTGLLQALIAGEGDCIPVIAPIGIGKNGKAYNINADWAAARLAQGLGIKKMLFLTDQDGILDAQKKVIPELDAGQLEQLIETGVVSGGMLAKTRTIIHALRNGVTDVHVLNARHPHGLIEELFTDRGIGTACRLRSLASANVTGSAKETANASV